VNHPSVLSPSVGFAPSVSGGLLQENSFYSLLPERRFKTLRLSLTPVCNMRCLYCNPVEEGGISVDLEGLLSITRNLHHHLQLTTVRITGGEPTLVKGLPDIIGELKEIGIEKLAITTNGFTTDRSLFTEMKNNGLNSVNFSLDSLDQEIFSFITGLKVNLKNIPYPLDIVLASIDRAIAAGLAVKVNMIVIKGVNDLEISRFIRYFGVRGVTVRFLELMDMSLQKVDHREKFFSKDEILKSLADRFLVRKLGRPTIDSTAEYYSVVSAQGVQSRFGIIANHSEPFCAGCSRLRLDSNGVMYGCLSDPRGIDLKGVASENYPLLLEDAMGHKQKERFSGSAISMKRVGG